MYEFIKGKIVVLTPTFVIIEVGDIVYKINISLNAYESLSGKNDFLLLLHQIIREDAHLLFGFISEEERELFRELISVSGIGANTAMVILSSLKTTEIIHAIINANVSLLKSIKGIGPKTAQRIIVELQDNLKSKTKEIFTPVQFNESSYEEAINALVMLGFKKSEAEKLVMKVLTEHKYKLSTEEIIKIVLKGL